MGTVITLSDIYYRYTEAPGPWVLQGIDLDIEKGEYLLLCGRSGSGKSTLGYLLNGLIPHFLGGVRKGAVTILGKDIRHLSLGEMMSGVGMVFQNANAQLFNSSVKIEIAYGLESLGLPPREISEKIRQTAKEIGIEHLMDCSPSSLSGGEKRLVAIAAVFCLSPPILVLDEPMAHLDREGADRVLKVLRRLHRKGTTLLVIEQRVDEIVRDSTRCVVLKKGKIIFDGPTDKAGPVIEEQHLIPRYSGKHVKKYGIGNSILEVSGISHVRNGSSVITGISMRVNKGEIVVVLGRNGSGKTTLVKHFNKLLRPSRGLVLYRGKTISNIAPFEMAGHVGISFQNPNDQFFRNTVRDELMVGLKKLEKKEREKWFHELCSILDLHELLDQSPYRLSEGQKKRVAIACILAMKPQILVLDEPTVGQDGHFLEIMASLILSLQARGFTIVIVTHDLDFARAVADRQIVLDHGQIITEKVLKIEKHTPSVREDRRIEDSNTTKGAGKEIPSGRFDPRTKMVLGGMGIAAVLITRETVLLFAFLGLIIGSLMFTQGKKFLGTVRLIVPLTALVSAITIISFPPEIVLRLVLRLFDLLSLSALFFQTMDPSELGDIFRKMGFPYEFSFILTTSLRYVPLIGRKIHLIMDSQTSRGIDLRPKLRNVPGFMALLMPLLVQSFILAEELAMAIELRGFERPNRSFYKEYRISFKEYIIIGSSLCLLTIFFAWQKGWIL